MHAGNVLLELVTQAERDDFLRALPAMPYTDA